MTLTYRIDKEPTTATTIINSFEGFVDFLWQHKVGKDRDDPRMLGFWAESYRGFMNKPLNAETMFARYRTEGSSHLVIVEVSNQY